MTEVRRHQRTVDGRTVNVRHHTRSGTGTAAERKREAWEDRAAQRWTPPPRGEATEAPPADETWWDDDVPKPEAWTDNDDHVGHEGHVFKVNRAPAPPPPRGDYDFAEPGPTDRKARRKAMRDAQREYDAARERYRHARRGPERAAAKSDLKAAEGNLRALKQADHERWEADMKAAAERRGLPAYRPIGTKASWWKKRN